MRQRTRILFSLPHNGGAHGAPAQGAAKTWQLSIW
jgi:hypothetical protein